jgi:apolipoprotein N-acyltransferase
VRRVAPYAFAAASGLLLVAAFPDFDLWVLAWFALVPLLLAVSRLTLVGAALAGLVCGCLYQLLWGWWLLPAGVHPASYLAGGLFCALYVGAFAGGVRLLRQRRPAWAPLAIPSLWVVLEYVRASLGWLAAPWALLGHSQYQVPAVAAVAALAGVWGVSFLLAAVNTLLADLAEAVLGGSASPQRRPGIAHAVAVVGIAALLAAGWLHDRKLTEPAAGPSLRVAVVQAGVYVPGVDARGEALRTFERYRALTRRAAAEAQPELIVWPEAAMPTTLPDDAAARQALGALARETGAHLLVATSGRDKSAPRAAAQRFANSVFLFSPEGEIAARYDKIRLLPFNEYIPLRGVAPWPSWIAAPMTDARRGGERTVFRVNGIRFGTLICWENLFSSDFRAAVAQGVDLMASMSNEAFIASGPGRHQLFAINAFHAVENGVPVVRAATTGVSAVVSPRGEIVARVSDGQGRDLDVEGFAVRDVPVRRGDTPYVRFGDWLLPLLTGVLGAAIATRPRERG